MLHLSQPDLRDKHNMLFSAANIGIFFEISDIDFRTPAAPSAPSILPVRQAMPKAYLLPGGRTHLRPRGASGRATFAACTEKADDARRRGGARTCTQNEKARLSPVVPSCPSDDPQLCIRNRHPNGAHPKSAPRRGVRGRPRTTPSEKMSAGRNRQSIEQPSRSENQASSAKSCDNCSFPPCRDRRNSARSRSERPAAARRTGSPFASDAGISQIRRIFAIANPQNEPER